MTFEYKEPQAIHVGELRIGDDGTKTSEEAQKLEDLILNGINFNKMARLVGTVKEGKEWAKVCVHGTPFDEACDRCKNIDFVIQREPMFDNN